MALTRLTDTDLVLVPRVPQFTETTAATIGNFGDATDGFDVIMGVPLASFNDDVDAMGLLDQHLLDMDFTPGDIGNATLQPVGDAMLAFTASGDNILSGVNDAITPPQPDTGGTGSGGGGGTGDTGGGTGGGGGGSTGSGTGAGGGSGTTEVRCSLIVDPRTNQVLGTVCGEISLGGGGVHPPLQE